MIHGNSSAFYIIFEDIFKAIFEFWLEFPPLDGRLMEAGIALRTRIQVRWRPLILWDSFYLLDAGCQGKGGQNEREERHESVQQGGRDNGHHGQAAGTQTKT